MGQIEIFELDLTTQGPSYPPSELVDRDGDFITIGYLNRSDGKGGTERFWGRAIVSKKSNVPDFGQNVPYDIIRELNAETEGEVLDMVLYTLPLPLPCNNYPMIFAPEQMPNAHDIKRPSYPLHKVKIADFKEEYGRKLNQPVTYGDWIKAKGTLIVQVSKDKSSALFKFDMSGLVPNSLYTVMSLRENDLNPNKPSRPGPLGVPNVFITDKHGVGTYEANMPNPFPVESKDTRNRIINVIVLFVSTQMSYGGAIAHYGLGGDIHAHLKLKEMKFSDFITTESNKSN